MKTALFPLLIALALLSSPARALTPADREALRTFTQNYVSWDYSGRPVEFRERLDYPSYERQREILLELAALDWEGFWGKYWQKRGLKNMSALRSLGPKQFWLRYHSGLDPSRTTSHGSEPTKIWVDIHSLTESRGLVYVTYQAIYRGRGEPKESALTVLRARLVDGHWRLVAFPKVTSKLQRQLAELQRKTSPRRK